MSTEKNSAEIQKMISLINSSESTYSSWMRNMIILVGAGIAVHGIKDHPKLAKKIFLTENIKIDTFEIVSILLIIAGSVLGIFTLNSYIRKVNAARNMNYNEIYNTHFNTRVIEKVSSFVTLIYILVLFVIGGALFLHKRK